MRISIEGGFRYIDTINVNGNEYVKLDDVKYLAESVYFSALSQASYEVANRIELRFDATNQCMRYELKEDTQNV